MFDWFWSFLYLISKTLFKLIDGLIQCANYLCGVDPITINGEEVDFMEYILTSNQVSFAFKVSALIGIILVVVFSIIAILRTIAKEKSEGTPAQIVGKAIKSILSFLFIPVIMIVIVNAGNIFMDAMYKATMQGEASLGDFLFKAFAMESGVSEAKVDAFLADPNMSWKSTSDVWSLMDLGEFEFIFSWIAGSVILGCIGMSMMYFVSRVISIAILYIAAPFSIGASVLDDGARLKLWREQILIKFITGYGMMIAINIFAMICLLVMSPSLVFFSKGSFWDFLMKLLLIAGGGVALKQSMALIGNLVSNGAGSNELRDAAIAGGLSGALGSIPGSGIVGGIGTSIKQEVTGKTAQSILPSWAQRSYSGKRGGGNNAQKDELLGELGSDSQNSNSPISGSGKTSALNAIMGKDNNSNKKQNNDDSNNKNDNKPNRGDSLVNNLINGVGKVGSNAQGDGFEDVYE